jgi:HK97 family phage prohead protease
MDRRTQLSPIELRDADPASGEGNTLVGYAAKYNVESQPLYDRNVCDTEFVEVLAPGCFSKTLVDNPSVAALYNHDTSAVLGRTDSKTLTLTDDETGLAFVVRLPNTSYANDVRELVKRGDILGCSFGFMVIQDELTERPNDYPLRTVKEVHLYEISPAVCFPAYLDTEVNVRSRKHRAPLTPIKDHCLRKMQILFA